MDTSDVKLDLSSLKMGILNMNLNSQPSDNLSWTDDQFFPSLVNLKQEQGTKQNTSREEMPAENKNEDTLPSDLNSNMNRQMEGNSAQSIVRMESSTCFSLESKERVECIFPGCQVLCDDEEALERHFNMRHATINVNTTTNYNYNDFPSPSMPFSSLFKPLEKKKKYNKNYTSTASSSCASSSATNPKTVDSPCKMPCGVPFCGAHFKTWEDLDEHRFYIHDSLPPLGTIDTISCTHPGCSDAFYNEVDMQQHFRESHESDEPPPQEPQEHNIVYTNGVNSSDRKFQCPLPSCENQAEPVTFVKLSQLETHCLRAHPQQEFPWCSPRKNIQCPIMGCDRHFNRQTSLESHLSSKLGGKSAVASYFDSLSSANAESENNQLIKCMFADCSYSTFDLLDSKHHHRLHTGDILRFRCNYQNCGTSFMDEAVMMEHRHIIHGQGKIIKTTDIEEQK